MAHWLMKTEPGDYSWDRLVADGETEWGGVRNHQAARNMRSMALGEEVFFYRSVVQPAVLGIMTVSRTWYPDPDHPLWCLVRVKPLRPLAREVPLAAIKAEPALAGIALIRQSRLSVMPVEDSHWQKILELGGG
ncbi:EVE domain-containing protein [Geminicoccus harenae]|uniref:EVE domain-containing protein n=1 Tax=Geminicoccus harenae TaxID=2498453 RepID=UPI00168A6759|nr:EVE domain-containing protein [Geminicoccus harenae]